MTALDRKLLRDLRHRWAQVLSIAAVVACGVMIVITMQNALVSLRETRDVYYTRYRFADVFVSLTRAPNAVASRVAELPGVALVEPRIVRQVILDVPGLAQPATGQLISLPSGRPPALNQIFLREGRLPVHGRSDEVLVSSHFAELNALHPGATLGAVINGGWQRLRVAGIAMSPEFTYEPTGTAIFGDARTFALLWMDYDAVAPAFGLTGAFNDLALALAPDASERAVIAAVDRVLEPYGGGGAYGRADQFSSRTIADELHQIRSLGIIVPTIFLSVSAFLLNIVLARLVTTQRGEIAILKAFGYGNARIAMHFLAFAMAPALIGVVAGWALGLRLGAGYTALYRDVFRFPILEYRTSWVAAGGAALLSAGAAALGALTAARRAARLPPAEGMRPETPARYRPLLLERLGVQGLVGPMGRMLLRTLERRPIRALTAVVGIGLAALVLVVGLGIMDSVRALATLQFDRVQHEDYTVSFTHVQPRAIRHALAAIPGVTGVELFRSVPVRVSHAGRSRKTELLGLDADGTLRGLVALDGERYQLPREGMLMSRTLATLLGVRRGDVVTVELLEHPGVPRTVHVAALLDEALGISTYMDLPALHRMLGEGIAATGAALAVHDPAREPEVFAALRRSPVISGAASRRAARDAFARMIEESMTVVNGIEILAAVIIAIGVVYNGARTTLSERGHELASLRVLGFTVPEVGRMLLGEQAILLVLGVPLGLAAGRIVCEAMMTLFQTELYRFATVITPPTYGLSAMVVVAAAVLAGTAMYRRVGRLDLVRALKARE